MDVGIRELKAKLSEYIERAARGEVVRVTDRGQPKVLLGPLPGRARINQALAEGWLRPGEHSAARRVRRVRARRRVLDVLAEDRER